MKNLTKEVLIKLVLLQILPRMQLSVVGKPLLGCSQTSEIELYDPTDPGAEIMCKTCPECPEGQGLSPQCGRRVPKDINIECIPCQENKSYSNSHGIESCKACQECGLKNVIQYCTTDKNRICGTKCPEGYFLDHNHICQECYFCCDSVSEAQRRQGCKDIGMSRNWQCEKTEQNQRCKEAFENMTTKPIDTELTVSPHHNTMTEKHVKTKSTKKEKEREEFGAASLRVVIGVASIIFVISALALMTSKRINQFCWFSRTKLAKLADNTELIPLNSICEPTDSGRASPQDILTNEAPPLSCSDIELTTEESGKEVGKPNPADIPADCLISEMEKLHDDKGNLMLFYIQNKLDALRTPTRKTWRSIGQVLQVSSDDLDLIETDYIAGRSPTESLLAKLKNDKREPTMREFVEALIICDRHDVADFIYKWPWGKPFCTCWQ